MMDIETAYGVLGVAPGSSPKEVQAAYRRRALESHPDRAGSPERAEAFSRVFLRVRDAYEALRAAGFPGPKPEELVEEPVYYRRTAGRSFAPKEEDALFAKSFERPFSFEMDGLLLWGVLMPLGAIGVWLFLRYLLSR